MRRVRETILRDPREKGKKVRKIFKRGKRIYIYIMGVAPSNYYCCENDYFEIIKIRGEMTYICVMKCDSNLKRNNFFHDSHKKYKKITSR